MVPGMSGRIMRRRPQAAVLVAALPVFFTFEIGAVARRAVLFLERRASHSQTSIMLLTRDCTDVMDN